ncbi:Oidioi.mRNA.OKI2018_I69.PAR.g8683.t1.cds [Oikopleura dioica]|uniref:Oidioi.mRNA.OKI2018_I69.PAR.g8683.t1.cds n=1 Tax=Oikopleura dioica TaxID=34765 RepID=A0ABN7RKQ4_OIKDI|nr:Oidioi.mRNA.OKI2018_I69.PAR.g8683.t1.cds [Oikopleura dioica]
MTLYFGSPQQCPLLSQLLNATYTLNSMPLENSPNGQKTSSRWFPPEPPIQYQPVQNSDAPPSSHIYQQTKSKRTQESRKPIEFATHLKRPRGKIEKRRQPGQTGFINKPRRVPFDRIDPDFVDSKFFEMLRFNRRQSDGSTTSTSSESSSTSLTPCVYDNSHLYPEHTFDPSPEASPSFSPISTSLDDKNCHATPNSTASSILTIFQNQQF